MVVAVVGAAEEVVWPILPIPETCGLAAKLNPNPVVPVLVEVGALVDGAPNVNDGADCGCWVNWVDCVGPMPDPKENPGVLPCG